MLSVLAASSVPLRVDALFALMEEKEKAEILQAYLGDISYSTLVALLSLGGK